MTTVSAPTRSRQKSEPDFTVQHLFESQIEIPRTGWRRFREGIDILPLYSAGVNGASAALIKYSPGARAPRHLHRGREHIIVLSGSQRDARGTYHAGDVIVNEAGTIHEVMSDEGCVVMAHWALPVLFLDSATDVIAEDACQ
jgi:anti-sigma factor ChrR (cupin superfamily)